MQSVVAFEPGRFALYNDKTTVPDNNDNSQKNKNNNNYKLMLSWIQLPRTRISGVT